MHIKKTVSEAVVAANKENSKNSTGPKTERGKSISRLNATTHGGTATVCMPSAEEPDYESELALWRRDYKPQGVWEEKLVKKIARLEVKDSILEKRENHELRKFQAQGDGDLEGLLSGYLALPLDVFDLPAQCGWNCEKVVVRASAIKGRVSSKGSNAPGAYQGQPLPGSHVFNHSQGNGGEQLHVEAVIGSTLERIQRYRTAIKRDLYKAVEALHAAQAERRERETDEGYEPDAEPNS